MPDVSGDAARFEMRLAGDQVGDRCAHRVGVEVVLGVRQISRIGQAPIGGGESGVQALREIVAVFDLGAGIGIFLAELFDVGTRERVRLFLRSIVLRLLGIDQAGTNLLGGLGVLFEIGPFRGRVLNAALGGVCLVDSLGACFRRNGLLNFVRFRKVVVRGVRHCWLPPQVLRCPSPRLDHPLR